MKKNITVMIALGISLSTTVLAQSNYEDILPPAEKITEAQKEVFVSIENMPQFPGGEDAMFKYLADNIVYPSEAMKQGIQGKVFVYFIIDELGKVKGVEVKRGVKGGENLNREALRVVKSMPDWIPGTQNGKPASVQFTVPVDFKLEGDKNLKK